MVSIDRHRYQYRVDRDDNIAWVNSWWLAFARENGATYLTESYVVGRCLWDFIADEEIPPILAAAKGRVIYAGRRSGYGLMIEIDHGNGYVTRYGHASKLLAQRGEEVTRGEVVAQVGNTGIATSPHLHYEVRINGRAVNPMNYVVAGAIP